MDGMYLHLQVERSCFRKLGEHARAEHMHGGSAVLPG